MENDVRAKAKTIIKKLIRSKAKLEKKGGPEKAGELFEEVIGLQDDLLELYDLSSTTENLDLVNSLIGTTAPESAITTLTQLLLLKARGEERKSPFEVLYEGILGDDHPHDVLAKMGLVYHDYYEYLFLFGREHPELALDLFNEMCRAEKYLSEVYLLKDTFAKLENRNLQYLRGYLSAEGATTE